MSRKRFASIGVFVLAACGLVPVLTAAPAGAVQPDPPIPVYSDCNFPPGAVDVSPQITNFLSSLTTGQTGTLPAGCYKTDSQITFNNQAANITFDGSFTTFTSTDDKSQAATFKHFQIVNGNSLTVKNVTIWGTHTGTAWEQAYETQHGFDIAGGVGVTVTGARVDHVFGDYVSIHRYLPTGAMPTFISVTNGYYGLSSVPNFSGAGRQELSIIAGTGITVTGNYFAQGDRSAIDLEPNGATADGISNVTISQNIFGPNTLGWFDNHGANASIDNVVLDSNTLQRSMAVDILAPNHMSVNTSSSGTFTRHFYTFSNNVQQSGTENGTGGCGDVTTGNAMRVLGVWGLLVNHNTIRIDPSHACQYLLLAGQSNTRVTNNILLNGQTWPNMATVPPALVGKYVVALYPQGSSTPGSNDTIACERGNTEPDAAHAAPITPSSVVLINGHSVYYRNALTWTPPNIPASCSGY